MGEAQRMLLNALKVEDHSLLHVHQLPWISRVHIDY